MVTLSSFVTARFGGKVGELKGCATSKTKAVISIHTIEGDRGSCHLRAFVLSLTKGNPWKFSTNYSPQWYCFAKHSGQRLLVRIFNPRPELVLYEDGTGQTKPWSHHLTAQYGLAI